MSQHTSSPAPPRGERLGCLQRCSMGRRAAVLLLVLALAPIVLAKHETRQELRWTGSHPAAGRRRLLQGSPGPTPANLTSTIVNSTRDGGFLVTGSLLVQAKSATTVTVDEPASLSGFETTLNASSLTTSPVASGAACLYVAFAASKTVDVFLSTYDDFVSLVTDKGTYDLGAALPVRASSFRQALKGNATVRTDPAEYYVLVLANTGPPGAASVLYQFASYSANSTVCRSAGTSTVVNAQGRASTSVAPTPAPALASAATTPFFFDFSKLMDGDIELVSVITNAACIKYQLLGQLKSAAYQKLDLAAFLTTTRGTLDWAATGFAPNFKLAVPRSLCTQNVTSQGLCQAGVVGLNKTEQYYFWVANGLQYPTTVSEEADAPLRYTARSEGDCADVTFPRQPKTTQS